MPIHWNAGKVIGGIEAPRFMLVGPNISPNISFEENLSGISGEPGTRELEPSTPFGDYVLKVDDDSTSSREFVTVQIDTGETIANKRFILFAHVRNSSNQQQAIWTDWVGFSNNQKDYIVDENWRRKIVHEIVVPQSATGNILNFRIYPTSRLEGNDETGSIFIDNLHFRRVHHHYIFPLPYRGQQSEVFREVTQAQHELIGGEVKRYRKGYRYLYEGGYGKIDRIFESYISTMRYSRHEMIFFPHKDAHHCYNVKFSSDLEREWAFGSAALGHQTKLSLISTELIEDIPDDVFDLTQYTYPADPFFLDAFGGKTIVATY